MRAVESQLTAQITSGDLAFPSKAQTLPPPETMFQRLREGKFVEVNDVPRRPRRPRGRRGRSLRERDQQSAPAFDSGFVEFVVSAAAYAEADCLADHFTETARLSGRVKGRDSPLVAWRRPAAARAIARTAASAWWSQSGRLEGQHVDFKSDEWTYLLREACYEHLAECTQFKPTIARQVCEFFGARHVLDPCAGWGDRALGAAAAGVDSYVGVDPNPRLIDGHAGIKQLVSPVRCEFHPVPFEDYAHAGEAPDLVFTSPPFHDFEVYADDPTQSTRFADLAEWTNEWYLPMVDKAWGLLAPGGHLALYIAGDSLTQPLAAHMRSKNRQFRGTIGCRRGKKLPVFLWVWRK